jgi:oligopeptide/dipeptide ABC transporter ATP-binding protein
VTDVSTSSEPLLEICDLVKHYKLRRKWLKTGAAPTVKAVDGVSLSIGRRETLALVGESGCGKTTLGRLVLRLERPTAGDIRFDGSSWLELDRRSLREGRKHIQAIFQDPLGALDPRRTVRQSLVEALDAHRLLGGRSARSARAGELLESVGLRADVGKRYPHELSGGQRQRVTVARAIAVSPKFIVADEAVSALDVSVQAQIINLLADLQESLDISYLFISHGLATVRHVADRVGVMYLGKLVELAPAEALFSSAAHPYTTALLAAAPAPEPRVSVRRRMLTGEIPSATNLPSGCRFRTRCPKAQAPCAEIEPPLAPVREGHEVACHFPDLSPATSRREPEPEGATSE